MNQLEVIILVCVTFSVVTTLYRTRWGFLGFAIMCVPGLYLCLR